MKPNWKDYLKAGIVTTLEVIGVLLVMFLIIAAIFFMAAYPIIFATTVLVGLIIMIIVQVCQDFLEKVYGYANDRLDKDDEM